ncbi:hypothetical protein [Aminobacterium colombiense]|uniref:hypothetical protein n=1 Tax=Aminobacterium colombiense TaxID=81468 RepID=UPI00145C999D|nr:hypothetical protein [Aminobacterium colombiense]
MRAQGLSDRTIYDYDCHITAFFTAYPDAWSNDKLKPSLLSYLSRPVMPETYNLRLVYLRHFFDWCIMEDFLRSNPTNRLTRRREEPRIVNIPIHILQSLLKQPDPRTAGPCSYTSYSRHWNKMSFITARSYKPGCPGSICKSP